MSVVIFTTTLCDNDAVAKRSHRNLGDLVFFDSRMGLATIMKKNCVNFVPHKEKKTEASWDISLLSNFAVNSVESNLVFVVLLVVESKDIYLVYLLLRLPNFNIRFYFRFSYMRIFG